jgi:hypothetical protein
MGLKYGSWTCIYICNKCQSHLKLSVCSVPARNWKWRGATLEKGHFSASKTMKKGNIVIFSYLILKMSFSTTFSALCIKFNTSIWLIVYIYFMALWLVLIKATWEKILSTSAVLKGCMTAMLYSLETSIYIEERFLSLWSTDWNSSFKRVKDLLSEEDKICINTCHWNFP